LRPACLDRRRYLQGIPPQTARMSSGVVAVLRTWAARARSAVDGANATGFAIRGRTARATIGGAPHSLTRLRRSAGRCAGPKPGGSRVASPGARTVEPLVGPCAGENARPSAAPCTDTISAAACMPSSGRAPGLCCRESSRKSEFASRLNFLDVVKNRSRAERCGSQRFA
jgi:hypothetical protein